VANETFLDASGATKYRKSTGAGSVGDPAVAHNIIDGTVTVTGAGGTFPVTDNGGSLTVDGTVAATQSGTWTVQPGNTANTTAWLVTGTGGTFPVTGPLTDTQLRATAVPVSLTSTTITGTVAATQSGTWAVTDGGGSLTVDGTVAISGSVAVTGTFWQATQPVSIASTVTVTGTGGTFPVTDSGGSLTVDNGGTFVVQENGAALTSLQLLDNIVLAEDAAHVSGDPGIQSLAVRNDADTSLAGTTGDYTPLQVDANGYLKVNIKAGAGSGGTASTDDAAFTAGSGSGTPMMGFVTSDPVDSGDVGVIGMLANRQVKVTLYDSAGSEVSVGSSPTSSGTSTTDNLLVMLMRIVKLLESNAVVDQQQRQRISVDSFIATVPTVSSVTTCSTVTSVSNVAAQTALAGMDREMYINAAKQTYCQSIRSRLVIS
jgi:hypothetical protein